MIHCYFSPLYISLDTTANRIHFSFTLGINITQKQKEKANEILGRLSKKRDKKELDFI